MKMITYTVIINEQNEPTYIKSVMDNAGLGIVSSANTTKEEVVAAFSNPNRKQFISSIVVEE